MLKKLLIGALLTSSVSAIASAPANAGSITNVSIGGTNAKDYVIYDANSKNTFVVDNTLANVQKVLDGNAQSPTGNVELGADTPSTPFDFTKNTTLNGTINGRNIQLSTLTKSDWTTTFVTSWLQAVISANYSAKNLSAPVSDVLSAAVPFLSNIFVNYGGEQRFSGPNISYVNQNDTTGLISIGLAGHYNANNLLSIAVNEYLANPKVSQSDKIAANQLLAVLGNSQIQASEFVKVSYNGGPYQLLYSFSATHSGLVAINDGVSHSGNYELTLQGLPASTPEPSALLGLLGVGALFAAQRQLKGASRRSCNLPETRVSG